MIEIWIIIYGQALSWRKQPLPEAVAMQIL